LLAQSREAHIIPSEFRIPSEFHAVYILMNNGTYPHIAVCEIWFSARWNGTHALMYSSGDHY